MQQWEYCKLEVSYFWQNAKKVGIFVPIKGRLKLIFFYHHVLEAKTGDIVEFRMSSTEKELPPKTSKSTVSFQYSWLRPVLFGLTSFGNFAETVTDLLQIKANYFDNFVFTSSAVLGIHGWEALGNIPSNPGGHDDWNEGEVRDV